MCNKTIFKTNLKILLTKSRIIVKCFCLLDQMDVQEIGFVMSKGACKNYASFYQTDGAVTISFCQKKN